MITQAKSCIKKKQNAKNISFRVTNGLAEHPLSGKNKVTDKHEVPELTHAPECAIRPEVIEDEAAECDGKGRV